MELSLTLEVGRSCALEALIRQHIVRLVDRVFAIVNRNDELLEGCLSLAILLLQRLKPKRELRACLF